MPTPRLKDDHLREVVAMVEDAYRAGFAPGMGSGSENLALQHVVDKLLSEGAISGRQAVYDRLRFAKERLGLVPDATLFRPARYQQPVPRQVIHPAAPAPIIGPVGSPQRILVIGDLHQCPRHPDRLQALTWIARYASDLGYDRIVQVGDWSTFDSVNQHDRNDTQKARFKPGVRDDLDNLLQSHQAFRRGIAADYKPKMTFLQGNHEYRVERFENANPETVGTFSLSRDETFAQFGWQTRPYGELYYVEGVAFTHHPTNGAGRAYGGKTGPQRAANESTVPVVSGHTHRRQVHDSPKIGPIDTISMVEVGCGMLWGEVESYAAHSLTGWWWGVVPMTVQGGAITDLAFTSMLALRAKYSDDGGDVRAA